MERRSPAQAGSVHVDVIIAGVGPSGAACALALRNSGLKVLLFDASVFPRDKICGDAIPGDVLKWLQRLDPAYTKDLLNFGEIVRVRESRLLCVNGREIRKKWVRPALNCTRLQFDYWLLKLVKEADNCAVHEGEAIQRIESFPDRVRVHTQRGQYTASCIIGADGAHSRVVRDLSARTMDRDFHTAALRRYYRGIKSLQHEVNEFFISRRYRHAYLWIFPVSDTVANVGFGMHSKWISRSSINLKKAFEEVLCEIPELRARFAGAEPLEAPQGFGLPLAGRKTSISGHRYLLCGDAASLINPLTGSGIDTAIGSGIIAAEHILANIQDDRLTADSNRRYDEAVYRSLGRALHRDARWWRLYAAFPRVLDLIGLFKGRIPAHQQP
jgi:geranylgeranyl reductase family protein